MKSNEQPKSKIREVMIGTPTYDRRLDAAYVDSLINTMRITPQGFNVSPVFVPGDALVQRARNYLVSMALDAFDGRGVDDLVFIDSDTFWRPEDFWKLLSHDLDIVGGAVRQKSDEQVITVRLKQGVSKDIPENGLVEVAGIGCGFTRYSAKALRMLWKAAREYKNGDKSAREVFHVAIERGELVGEDIEACYEWARHKGKIWLDTTILCGHVGVKEYITQPMNGK